MALPHRSLNARLVLWLGSGAALCLGAAAFLDFGDPAAGALDRLEAQARSEAELIERRWSDALGEPEWLAQGIAPTAMGRRARWEASPSPLRASPRSATSPDEENDAIRILGARALGAEATPESLRERLVPIIQRGGSESGAALLELTLRLRAMDQDPSAAGVLMEHGPGVPWDAAVEGTSGRLLALFAAAETLPPSERDAAKQGLEAILAAGEVALPAPVDTASAAAEGFEFTEDPWWTALSLKAAATLGGGHGHWRRAFRQADRRATALGALAHGLPPDRWTLTAAGEGSWLAQYPAAGGGRAAIHSARELDEAVARLGSPMGDLIPTAFSEPASLGEVVRAPPLEGTGAPLVIRHGDLKGLAARENRRLRWLRGGLLALAALVLLTTATAARAIARSRALHGLRSTFVASVSHDLRTPLASISLMTENLSSGYAKGSEERYVQSIRRETARLTRLVNDLLDFGRVERGLLPNLTRRELDVNQWFEALGSHQRARCAAAGAALSTEAVGSLGQATLDPEALERAVANLVDNALKHGGARSIRLRARRDTAEVLTLEVEDEGTGLAGGVALEHLFEPFERRASTEGTGLGLTIVRAIAEAHGGSASLERSAVSSGVLARLRVSTAQEAAA